MEKVLLILVDGMRPDAIAQCGNPFLPSLMKETTHTLNARTIMPSVTLPCHSSLFFSVLPERHGITTNLWMPPVRPIDGIADVVSKAGKKAAFFTNWEQLRDLSSPGHLVCSYYLNAYVAEDTDKRVTDKAMEFIADVKPDFVFLYLGQTDVYGHKYGWMTEQYLDMVGKASANIQRIFNAVKEEYNVIVTADHGGHDRIHGTEMPEDMTIPIFLHGPRFEAGRQLTDASILDIAPTIIDLMGLQKPSEWEGKSLI